MCLEELIVKLSQTIEPAIYTQFAWFVQRPRTPAFHAGNTGSNPVGGASRVADSGTDSVLGRNGGYRHRRFWSRGAVWSARRPVKAEAAGSNPVGTAERALPGMPGELGRVAQLAERPPEKR